MAQESGPRHLKVKIASEELALRPDLTYTIGHGEDNDIRIGHNSISEHHAWLCYREGEIYLKDLGSVSGTWVDGQRIESAHFMPGSKKLRIGEIDIKITVGNPSALILPQFQSTHTHHRHNESFKEIMAAELRRTPWFTASAAFHALIIWILYLLLPAPPPEETSIFATLLSYDFQPEIEADNDQGDEPIEIEEMSEAEQILQELDVNMAEEDEPEIPSEEFNPQSNRFADSFGPSEILFERLRGKSSRDVLNLEGDNKLSGGFKRTVTKLRRSGLEVIFVFDSTGSMKPVLEATKVHIERMVDVLHFLVPESRIGIVTYRDRGITEDYLTRSIPLGSNYYRSVNFMQSVRAGGGGDAPEAIFEALAKALDQSWHDRAKRVVVLIGDAPAHPKTQNKIKRMLRRFVRDGRSYVHAIVTAPHSGKDAARDVQRSFRLIAKSGRGSCIFLEEENTILKHVFSLAIGNEYRDNIDEVYGIAARRQERVSTKALDMVQRLDFKQIERQLRKPNVTDDLVKALSRKQDREMAIFLVGLLRRGKFPKTGREAAAYALKRILDLERPPINSEDSGAINRRTEAWLRRRIDRHL